MDRRNSTRRRSLLNGRIVFNNRCSVIECTVRDISETGAKISLAHPTSIPMEFELDIPSKGPPVRAHVMWSNGKECGVLFGSRAETPGASRGTDIEQTSLASGRIENLVPHGVQTILNEARQRIAQLSGVPVDAVNLRVEISATAGDQ
ncbi:PilZ domain-containing protein [Microvirga terrae]|uniref:PilZ domain-containing protein n=1 Tax=Microvirga terrae TaxID=2740529 RepID=UPI001570FE53